MAKYVFPAVFEKTDDGYDVSFPDIENCFTCGSDIPEAFEMDQDVLPLMLSEMEDDKKAIPKPTYLKSIVLSNNEFTSYIFADTDAYRKNIIEVPYEIF